MAADRAVLLEELRTAPDLRRVLSEHVLDATPHIFDGDRRAFISWKTELAGRLDVAAEEIYVVGSASTGLSLNPDKPLLREFSAQSDIDLAVVSDRHFNEAWYYFRQANLMNLPGWARREIHAHVPTYVYWGSIPTEKLLRFMPFSTSWLEGLSSASEDAHVGAHPLKIRIYRDARSLHSYQMIGLEQARNRAMTEQKGVS